MQMVRQDDDGLNVERMAPPNIAERLPQEIDVIDEKTKAPVSQIGREEKAAAADKVSPIVRHRASVAAEGDGFRGACHRAGHFGPDPLAQPILRATGLAKVKEIMLRHGLVSA